MRLINRMYLAPPWIKASKYLIPSLDTPLRRCLAVVEAVAAVPAASAAMDAEGMI